MPASPERPGLLNRALREIEERAGVSIMPTSEARVLEEAYADLRVTYRELDLLGYSVLDFFSGNPSELRPESRRMMAKKSLVAWMNDPQAYRATETLNDFTFGRGVPKPRAKDPAVQRALDDFWNDPDNKILITTSEGQKKVGRDLTIQSNVSLLIFDTGDDGKIKVGLLAHDGVESVVRDENNRLRILYFTARERQMRWNYATDRYETAMAGTTQKLLYYEHWLNPQALRDDGIQFETPPKEKMGDGKVYHLVENATTEMAFGVPMMQRTLRWFSAYNDLMAARVDMMKAAAAFIMKRQVKGTPNQLAKMATKAISRTGPLAGTLDMPDIPVAGRAASILNENDAVTHSPLKLDSGSSGAQQDAAMLHGQISAGSGLPKHYLGEPDANLATATALELPVLKLVESRQETFEAMYRAMFDMVIQRAVDMGLLDRFDQESGGAGPEPVSKEVDDSYLSAVADNMQQAGLITEEQIPEAMRVLREAYEDETQDEEIEDRDLSYEFSMPSPLRRQMTDLVTSVQIIAQTFDPNNTNIELSRSLLAIALGEALEVDDPADLVEKIFPPGYVDPMIQMAAQAQQQDQQDQQTAAAAGGAGGGGRGGTAAVQNLQKNKAAAQPAGAGNSYGGRMQSQSPEQVASAQEGTVTLRRRDGSMLQTVPLRLREATDDELLSASVKGRAVSIDALFDTTVGQVAAEELERLAMASNGHHEAAE